MYVAPTLGNNLDLDNKIFINTTITPVCRRLLLLGLIESLYLCDSKHDCFINNAN